LIFGNWSGSWRKCARRGARIDRWETFLDAMSATRSQDEYNEKVKAADIFVSLFKTKVGKFTEEEFDVAHRSFKETGKPRIFTFFQDAQVPVDARSLPGLQTVVAFQERLKGFGRFCSRYESAEHLKRIFRDRLDLLFPAHGRPGQP
jgi:hypothetical protein